MTAPLSLFASCAPGLEPLLASELAALGALSPRVVPGGVAMQGHRRLVYRVNLESGLASHVLVRVGAVEAERFDTLTRALGTLPWERFLLPGVGRAVRAAASKSRLHHSGALEERALRAIADRLGDGLADPDPEGVPIALRMVRDRATLSVDTSGVPLHRRGYRLAVSAAPLREDLARALLVASGWDATTPLVDPFCGAGTLAIEGIALARRLAPGRQRTFAFERTPLMHEPTWTDVRAQAEAAARGRAPAPVLASDRDPAALEATHANAARAGVADDLAACVATVSELDLAPVADAPTGLLVANPPYGHRLGNADALAPLYRTLGRRARELPPGWTVAVVTSERRLGMLVSPRLRAAFLTDSGGLRVRALVGPAA